MVRNDIGQISERRQEEREMSGQERIESIRSIRELLIGGSDRVTTGKLIRFCWKCNFIISRTKIDNKNVNCFGSLRAKQVWSSPPLFDCMIIKKGLEKTNIFTEMYTQLQLTVKNSK